MHSNNTECGCQPVEMWIVLTTKLSSQTLELIAWWDSNECDPGRSVSSYHPHNQTLTSYSYQPMFG